ncbi:MAG TPA: DUF5946 family protein [Promineifilum sp.]|nr:DUF5946 family protein [Promineifilum sp.]HRO92213.1 DUF5946 family protein [Promineifilum sp.]HRQ14863.1 DUF5946 family protein [Promineifilum sp.]
MTSERPLIPCTGCGALVPNEDGPTHRYVGASPGCWAIHGEVLARGYSAPGFGDELMLQINSYCVQHPGTPSPQSIQSVCVHLIGLYLVLERNFDGRRALEAVRAAADGSRAFHWLEPPTHHYEVTILDIHRAGDPAAYAAALTEMARLTWAAWSNHHSQVRSWAAELGLY